MISLSMFLILAAVFIGTFHVARWIILATVIAWAFLNMNFPAPRAFGRWKWRALSDRELVVAWLVMKGWIRPHWNPASA